MISSATTCSSRLSSSSTRSSSHSPCSYRPSSYSSSSSSVFTILGFFVALVMMLSLSTTAEGARIPRSLTSLLKHPEHYHKSLNQRELKHDTECSTDQRLSAICYQCGERDTKTFTIIYNFCCENIAPYRDTCQYMFIEDPKRGGSYSGWDY